MSQISSLSSMPASKLRNIELTPPNVTDALNMGMYRTNAKAKGDALSVQQNMSLTIAHLKDFVFTARAIIPPTHEIVLEKSLNRKLLK